MLQLQETAEFALLYLSSLFAMVLGVFHHVIHAFHLAAHLHNSLRGVHHLVDRCQEGTHEPLEGHQHTYSQFSFQYQVGTEDQYRHIHQAVGQHWQQRHLCLFPVGISVHIELMCPQAAPVFEEARLGTRGLDALHVVDA